MGERTPPKTRGFWIPFWSISMRRKKVPQGIGHGPAPAAADVAGRDHWQFYRFKRLSNRALAAAGRKCRCGPLGRKIRQASAPPRGTRERQRLLSPSTGACHSTPPARCVGAAAGMGVQAIRYGTFLYRGWNRTREIQKPLVFGGVLFHISFAAERNMAAGGKNAGRGRGPQSENEKRAVGDAGPYGGIDESTPVLGGAPMRAVGDAGPYGVRLSGCAGKCGRGAGRKKRDQDRTRCAIGVGGGESRRCHSAGTK